MNPPSFDSIRGTRLRHLRQAQGMDLSDLARHVNLSVAQLQQLESGDLQPGERSLFYTAPIRDKAAMKVAKALGADPQTLLDDPASASGPDVVGLRDAQIVDDLADLYKKQAQTRKMLAGERRFSWKWLLGAFGALWMVGAVGYYGPSVSAWVDSHKPVAAPEAAASEPLPQPALAEASLPVAAPVAASESTPAVPDPSLIAAEALCDNQVPQATTLSVSQPSKSGGSVHVVAQADLVMCARDGSGKSMPVNLKAQESRTLWGKAPWSLRIEKPVPMHMFFQGQKIYWPEGEVSAVILKEVAGDY